MLNFRFFLLNLGIWARFSTLYSINFNILNKKIGRQSICFIILVPDVPLKTTLTNSRLPMFQENKLKKNFATFYFTLPQLSVLNLPSVFFFLCFHLIFKKHLHHLFRLITLVYGRPKRPQWQVQKSSLFKMQLLKLPPVF